MIRPGRARRGPPQGLDAHERFARTRRRAVRAHRAALAAAATAVVTVAATLIGAPRTVVLLVPLVAVIAGLTPVPGAAAWARRYLRSEQGLGYDTALEAAAREDPFGLWDEARERARLDVRGVTPPPTDWRWLVPTVATLVLLAALPFTQPLRSSLENPSGQAAGQEPRGEAFEEGGTSVDDADQASGTSADDAPDAPLPTAGLDADPPSTASNANPQRGEGQTNDTLDAGGEADGTEDAVTGPDAVDQFLQRDDPTDEPASAMERPGDADPASAADGAASRNANGETQAPPNARDGNAPEDVDTSATRIQPDAGQDGEGSGAQGVDAEAPEASDGDEPTSGEADAQATGERMQASRPEADGAAQEGTLEENAGAQKGEVEGTPDRLQGDVDASADAGTEGAEAEGLTGSGDTPNSDASRALNDPTAGNAPGAATAVDPATGPDAQPAERLSGDPGQGPSVTIGTTRDLGARPDAPPPVTPRVDVDGRRARDVERITEETNLPAAYREIVRRYFR